MNIGVDAHVISGKFQGSRTYLLNLYKAIMKYERKHNYIFFGYWDRNDEIFGSENKYINFNSNSRVKRLTYESNKLVKRNSIDIFHSQYISPLSLNCESIVTIHDILFESNPQFFTKSEVFRNRLLVSYSAKKAKQIHTVSEYSKKEISETYNIDPEKIKVIPNGVNLNKFNNINKSEAKEYIYTKFGIKDYILTVGRIEPRKNHTTLINAYAILKQKEKNAPPLVIVGKRDFGYDDIYTQVRQLDLLNDIVFLEEVDDNDLPLVYKSALVFVYPSFAEGFGIPPLEAMASGVPVISSNTTAIPEVIEEAGLLVNPFSTEEISNQLEKLLTNRDLYEQLVSKSRIQAEKWSWEKSAEKYIEAINEIVL
ncbi:glycosyltransferase family 4 protein [Niallia circulans]|uniref:glycosyltransferase family 4 protein n=1 Tax=Niallia circulans TaxID=1397 RepID=UPI00069F68A7|nr:glycosyltransferase family 1 protein [Niallia circulans]